MFGVGGAKGFGMGVVLTFKNVGKGAMRTAAKDFRYLEMSAKKADAQIANSLANMRTGFRGFIAGGLMVGLSLFLSNFYSKTEQAYADLKTLSVKNVAAIERSMHDLMVGERLAIDWRTAEKAIYDLKSAGVRESDLVPAIKEAGITALATLGTVQDAVDAYTSSYNLFFNRMTGTIEQKSKRWSDVFATSVELYKTKLPQLSRQFNMVAGQAALMGYNLEQIVPAVGALITGGMGERSGRGLSRVFIQLSKAEEVLGVRLSDARGKAYPLIKIIDILNKKFMQSGYLSIKQQQLFAKAFDVFGARAIQILMLMRNRYLEGVKLAYDQNHAIKMMEERTRTLRFEYVRLKNASIGLFNTWSKQGEPVLKSMVGHLADYAESLDKVSQKHPIIGKTLTTGLGASGVFLALGSLIWMVRAAAGQWGFLIGTMARFKNLLIWMTGPIYKTFRALRLLTAPIDNIEVLVAGFSKWAAVLGLIGTLLSWINALLDYRKWKLRGEHLMSKNFDKSVASAWGKVQYIQSAPTWTERLSSAWAGAKTGITSLWNVPEYQPPPGWRESTPESRTESLLRQLHEYTTGTMNTYSVGDIVIKNEINAQIGSEELDEKIKELARTVGDQIHWVVRDKTEDLRRGRLPRSTRAMAY